MRPTLALHIAQSSKFWMYRNLYPAHKLQTTLYAPCYFNLLTFKTSHQRCGVPFAAERSSNFAESLHSSQRGNQRGNAGSSTCTTEVTESASLTTSYRFIQLGMAAFIVRTIRGIGGIKQALRAVVR